MTSNQGCALSMLAVALALICCTSHRDGTSVELSVASAQIQELRTDAGDRVTLESAYAVLSSIELLPCTQARVWPDLRALFGISIAHAHGISSATVWAAPQVLDLNETSQRTLSIAQLQPLPGEYCAVRVSIDQADFDTEGLPADPSMVGRSIFLQGRFTSSADGSTHLFRYFTALDDHIDLPFVDADGDPAAVKLSADHVSAEVRIEIDHAAIFGGLAWTDGEYEPNATTAVRNLLRSARAVVATN